MNTSKQLQAELINDFDILSTTGIWHDLQQRSWNKTVFSDSNWIQSWLDTFGQNTPLLIPVVRYRGNVIAAALFVAPTNVIQFGAAQRADYCDVLIDRALDDDLRIECFRLLLNCTLASQGNVKQIKLSRIPTNSPTVELTKKLAPDYHVVETASIPAPRMSMDCVASRLKKKSLKRHTKKLDKMGTVEFKTYTTEADISPRLEGFFQQHISRWAPTNSPSLFLDSLNKDFYRSLTHHLASTGTVRYSELTLDNKLVAAHYGFHFDDNFIWYKPCFEPSLAKLSPGEVLIKNLLCLAQHEGAKVFDFTIGGEQFKYRFATEVPTVSDLFISSSLTRAKAKAMTTWARNKMNKK